MRIVMIVILGVCGAIAIVYLLRLAPMNAYIVDEKKELVPAACYVYNVETHGWDRLKQTKP